MDETIARFQAQVIDSDPTSSIALVIGEPVLKVSQADDDGACTHEWEQREASIEFLENGVDIPFTYERCVKCERLKGTP